MFNWYSEKTPQAHHNDRSEIKETKKASDIFWCEKVINKKYFNF